MQNSMLLIVESLIGASGAILTYIMYVAINRSITNVLFGGYATAKGPAKVHTGVHKEATLNEVVGILTEASEVIIVPGYGLAVAHGQYPLADMVKTLNENGVRVRFRMHQVAGRMPGQLNVFLAEARISYDIVLEMDEINDDFKECNVSLVLGANDVVNPDANDDLDSALAGMLVLHAWEAKQSVMMKRYVASGYAGVDNPLFFKDNNWMFLGVATKVLTESSNVDWICDLLRQIAECRVDSLQVVELLQVQPGANKGELIGRAAIAEYNNRLFVIRDVNKKKSPMDMLEWKHKGEEKRTTLFDYLSIKYPNRVKPGDLLEDRQAMVVEKDKRNDQLNYLAQYIYVCG